MDHLVDGIAKLSQGRKKFKNWYIGREGFPVDDSLRKNGNL